MHIIKPVWLTHGGTELDRPGFLCLTLLGDAVLHESRAKPSYETDKIC
jgi:hypothetical protein